VSDIPPWARVTFLVAAAVTLLLVLLWTTYRLRRRTLEENPSTAHRLHRAAGRPWVVASAVTLLVVWGLALLAAPKLAPGWRSTAVIALYPRDPLRTDAQTLTLLGPRYVALLGSPRVLDEAAEKTGATEDEMRAGVGGEMEPETLVLRIYFSGDTAETSAEAANALAGAIVDEASSDPLVKARTVANAVAPRARTNPSIGQVAGLGLVAGLIAAVFVGVRARRRWR
jgi:capsular polysaccharide biosynthesis protein